MDSPVNVPKTYTDLNLDQLKIMFRDRISVRRVACAEKKYDLLKYLWKDCQIEDCYLEKYKINNRDEVSKYDDAFSKYLLDFPNRIFSGQNEYARQRLADRIQPIPEEAANHKKQTAERFMEKKFQIHEVIRSEIGCKWRDFGRHLRIKEGTLDTIDSEQNGVGRKVDEVFKVFEKECCSNEITYVDKVSGALIKSRRTDLARKVYEIMEKF